MPKTKQPRKTAKPSGPLDFRPTANKAPASRPADSPRLRPDQPYNAKHIASVVIHCAMDFDAAVRMLTKGWGLTELQISSYIEQCEHAPLVKQYIEEELAASGLDDTSKVAFVKLMWEWLRKGSQEERKKAATILGKGFIGERVSVDKPMPLPLEGLKDGIGKMLAPNVSETSDELAAEDGEPETDVIQ